MKRRRIDRRLVNPREAMDRPPLTFRSCKETVHAVARDLVESTAVLSTPIQDLTIRPVEILTPPAR